MVSIKIFALLAALGLAASQSLPIIEPNQAPTFPFNLIFALATSPESTELLKTLANNLADAFLKTPNLLGEKDAGAGFLGYFRDSFFGLGDGVGYGTILVNDANENAHKNPGSFRRTPIEHFFNVIRLIVNQLKVTIELVKSYIQAVRTVVSGLVSGARNLASGGSPNLQFLGKSIGSGLKVAGEGNQAFATDTTGSFDPYDYTLLQLLNLLGGSETPGDSYASVLNNFHYDYQKWAYENGANFEDAAARLK